MGLLILESKRDDLLLPYLEMLRAKGVEMTLGQFKGAMLDKLAAQGCMNNLSLGSNFYLAGATRYYFNGDLTTNKKAMFLETGDPSQPDQWNEEVCKRINALVAILRNAYIDTVGTSFEQPEDFGTMTIARLLRKYNKKINKELGDEEAQPEEEPVDTLDRNPRVGNGYTFDILYSYSDATKYNRATSPGAWCITYGQGHYDGYIRRLGIHYVIFLKDGYENIPRPNPPGPGYTRWKPHDEYGNSMIAVLQSNRSWEPVYITSRWNHGYGDTSGTEADHAYTLDEFKQITGVTDDDLKRIYEIWMKDKPANDNEDEPIDKEELKRSMLTLTRKLKYIQMQANYGGNIKELLQQANARGGEILYGNADAPVNKTVFKAYLQDDVTRCHFLCDRGKILFESLTFADYSDCIMPMSHYTTGQTAPIVFIEKKKNKVMVYNVRYHEFLTVNGTNVFKKSIINTEGNRNVSDPMYFEVKNGFNDCILVSTSDCRPLRLPNGEFISNQVRLSTGGYWRAQNQIYCDIIGVENGPVIEITYDISSGEKYFFNVQTKKFLEFNIVNDERAQYSGYGYSDDPKDYTLKVNTEFNGIPGYFSMVFSSVPTAEWGGYLTTPMLFNGQGQRISIYGKTKFKDLRSGAGRLIVFSKSSGDRYPICYDTATKKLVAYGNTPIICQRSYRKSDDGTILFIAGESGRLDFTPYYALDLSNGLLIKNKYGYPNEYQFCCEDCDDKRIYMDDFRRWKVYRRFEQEGRANPWEAACQEEKKHLAIIDASQWEHIENDIPVNNELEGQVEPVQGQATQPAYRLNEEKIRKMVSEALNRIMKW